MISWNQMKGRVFSFLKTNITEIRDNVQELRALCVPEKPVYEGQVTLEEYEDFVTGLASPDGMSSEKAKIGMGALGVAGEGGEVADIAKKVLYHGKPFDEETKNKMKNELGDVIWYIAFLARNVLDSSIQELIDMNVEKLQARYKSGQFTVAEFMEKEKKGDG